MDSGISGTSPGPSPPPSRTSRRKELRCDVCSKDFDKRNYLNTHRKAVHGQKNFVCADCGRGFTTKHHLRRHGSVHRLWLCGRPDCSLEFPNDSLLRAHVAKAHPSQSHHFCPECPYSSKRKQDLERHILTCHENGVQCPVEGCGMRCARSRLAAHIRSEHPNSLSTARNGLTIPDGSRIFQCSLCEKSYTDRRHLKRHQLETHENKLQRTRPMTCPECRKQLANKTKLEAHLNQHRGAKPYFCPELGCDKQYSGTSSLGRHLRSCHCKTLGSVVQAVTVSGGITGADQ